MTGARYCILSRKAADPQPASYNELMLRLMCITAHPDDEAGGFGGSLRLYHERSVETCVVCLTPGQAASHRGGAANDQELAAARRNFTLHPIHDVPVKALLCRQRAKPCCHSASVIPNRLRNRSPANREFFGRAAGRG